MGTSCGTIKMLHKVNLAHHSSMWHLQVSSNSAWSPHTNSKVTICICCGRFLWMGTSPSGGRVRLRKWTEDHRVSEGTDTWKSLKGPFLASVKGENHCQGTGDSDEPCCKGERWDTASQNGLESAKGSKVAAFMSYHQHSGACFKATAFESLLLLINYPSPIVLLTTSIKPHWLTKPDIVIIVTLVWCEFL